MSFGRFPFFFLLFCLVNTLQGQKLSSASTRWNDSFVAWELYTSVPRDTTLPEEEGDAPEEARNGELKHRWLNVRDDWSEWDYQLGEEQGTIKVKWKDLPTQWELRSYDGNVITMRTAWGNDYSEWRVTDNDVTLILKSKWKTQFDEWLVDDRAHGKFYMYTLRERDPRDWAIEDKLGAEISQSLKIALMFLSIFNSVPRI
ncbi:MAG: hypothetical protein WCR52_05855 [Bacteroidota bacterium]